MTTSLAELFTQASVEIVAVKPGFEFDPSADVESLIYAPARKALFFDETIPLYIVLRLPTTADLQTAKHLSSRISVIVEAVISDGPVRTNAPAPLVRQDSYSRRMNTEQGQTVYSKTLDETNVATLCQNKAQQIAVWCHNTPIPYTRTRTATARVSFGVTLTLNDANSANSLSDDGDSYMEDINPGVRDKSYNLLRALESDGIFSKDPPRITAARVSTMAPVVDSSTKKLRKTAKRFFPISPAVALRIRSFNVPFSGRVILTVDLEPKQGIPYAIMLESIDLQAQSAQTKAISNDIYPMYMGIKDSLTFSFDLEPNDKRADASVSINLIVKLRPIMYEEDQLTGPLIMSRWNTAINVSTYNNTVSMRRTPSQTAPRGSLQRSLSQQIGRPSSAMSSISADIRGTISNALSGILAELRAPAACQVGHTLEVALSITNESQSTKNLAIEVSRASRRKVLPQIPNTNGRVVLTDAEIKDLHAHHTQDSTMDLICLTTSIVLSPLLSDTRQDITLKYLPMLAGTTTLHDFRIVDTMNGHYRDFRDLPAVVIYKQQG